jgi:hypothetical protein
MFDWLPWGLLSAVVLHISEEFIFPGGFAVWYRRYRIDPSRVTPRFLIIVNALLITVCVNIALLGRTGVGVIYWLIIAAMLCSNGIWHVWASYKSRSYSPGMITGVVIYIPLALYGYRQFVHSGEASVRGALVAAIVGGSYQLWDALYLGGVRLFRKSLR